MTASIPIATWAKSQSRRQNTRKGNAFQNEIASFLRSHGWLVDVVEPVRRMIYRGGRATWMTTKEDLLGVFDLLALRPDAGPVLLIQATTSRGLLRRKIRSIEASGLKGAVDGREIMVWTRGLAGKQWDAWFSGPSGRWFPFDPMARYGVQP